MTFLPEAVFATLSNRDWQCTSIYTFHCNKKHFIKISDGLYDIIDPIAMVFS